eukprot:3188419-Alexandrium_andersonii.AAC.1
MARGGDVLGQGRLDVGIVLERWAAGGHPGPHWVRGDQQTRVLVLLALLRAAPKGTTTKG